MGRTETRGRRWGVWVGLAALTLACWGCGAAPPQAAGEEALISQAPTGGQILPVEATVAIGSQVIYLEVARTPGQQQIGLMFRQFVGSQCGMLFPFDPPRPVGFWMKNVPIFLDMVFLRDGVVREIAADVPPCMQEPCPLYGPREPIDRVIELAGGRAAELGLAVGDRLTIQPLAEAESNETPCP